MLRSREAALAQARSLLANKYSVQRITGPEGEEIDGASIEAFARRTIDANEQS